MGKTIMFTGVKLGCILRCIYNNGGGDGDVEQIDTASAVARKDPGSLLPEQQQMLAGETFGYFYADRTIPFGEIRDDLWTRMSVSIRGLQKTTPEWFSQKTRLIDVMSIEATSGRDVLAALGSLNAMLA